MDNGKVKHSQNDVYVRWNRAKQDKDVRKARCECPKHANSESR